MILEERLGVYDHKITQIMQFAEPSTKFLKKGRGLTGSQFLEGGCWDREGQPFSRGTIAVFT